ncbi:iron-containing alcohol dehydrogenase [Gonapodya prolifera JEL478]|uniref:Alcohol dehydrogenase 4 n=1 Tax=Gonapodya prolifera (strain JEL478) TaxID=1344416 RepID=A0A139AQ91_GONPJ|nr:iron-containing alcohol dehydrogenase [Gonapodya prolifera JEL478]|eukprot:KXS18892.1 iron-containing alcohol dehydrogenase [Gonapodya prolifera JEL478]
MEIGGGSVTRVADVLKKIAVGSKKALLVTDPFMVKSGLIDRVIEPLEKAGFKKGENYDIFKDTIPDPTIEVVSEGASVFTKGKFDSMIAFGGGSPIDTAKAIGILAHNGGEMRQYKFPNVIPRPGPPLIAVPTTAGTGSEVTKFTIITDTKTDEKMLISGPDIVASAAIVDYELTMGCPYRLTADTGIDSLTHAIEAYVSKKRNPFADNMALSAMSRIFPWIRTACAEPTNHEARENMMLGATLAGMAFSNSSVALVHGMSRPIGAFFHVPHGLSNAMLLPYITRFSLPSCPDRYAECARAMGLATSHDNDEVACSRLVDALDNLNRDLKVPTPAEYGIKKERWDEVVQVMAEQAIASGSVGNNPLVANASEIVNLYEEVWWAGREPIPVGTVKAAEAKKMAL